MTAYSLASSTPAYSPPMPPALAVLVECVRGGSSEALRLLLERAMAEGADLLLASIDHRLTSLLYVELRRRGLFGALPKADSERLRQIHAQYALVQDQALTVGLETLDRLRAAGVEGVLPVKGLALLAHWSPEYLPRPMQDLDLLVPPHSMEAAIRVLDEAGFVADDVKWTPTPWSFHVPPRTRDGVTVELHWRLWPSSPMQPFPLPTHDDLASRSVERRLLDGSVRVPSLEDCLIVQMGAFARDGFVGGLIRWADLYWVATRGAFRLDAKRLRAVADALEMGGFVDSVMGFAEGLFATDLLGPRASAKYDTSAEFQQVLWERLLRIRSVGVPEPVLVASMRRDDLDCSRSDRGEDAPDWLRSQAMSRIGGLGLMVGGLAAAGFKTLRYGGRLLVSREHRVALRESRTLRRHMGRLRSGRGKVSAEEQS